MSVEQIEVIKLIVSNITLFSAGWAACALATYFLFKWLAHKTPEISDVAQFGLVIYCKVNGLPAYQNLTLSVSVDYEKRESKPGLKWAFDGNLVDQNDGTVHKPEIQAKVQQIWAAKARVNIV